MSNILRFFKSKEWYETIGNILEVVTDSGRNYVLEVVGTIKRADAINPVIEVWRDGILERTGFYSEKCCFPLRLEIGEKILIQVIPVVLVDGIYRVKATSSSSGWPWEIRSVSLVVKKQLLKRGFSLKK